MNRSFFRDFFNQVVAGEYLNHVFEIPVEFFPGIKGNFTGSFLLQLLGGHVFLSP